MAAGSFSQGLELSLWVCTCFLIPQVVRGVAWYCSSEEPAASGGGNYHCTKDRDPGLGVMQMCVSGGSYEMGGNVLEPESGCTTL